MEPYLASIDTLVAKLKEEMFSKETSNHIQSFVSPSAYDTAWLAMIPHPVDHNIPLFKSCLEWLVDNQKEQGYWGESVNGDFPTIDALPATIACMVALQKWGIGTKNIKKGLMFIHENMVEMLHDHLHRLPRWFCIVFPTTIEHAESSGLELQLCDHTKLLLADISNQRQQILSAEKTVDKSQQLPLLAYLETLEKDHVDQGTITKHLSEDGSLFQSPSATAQAYISTRNQKCLQYLMSLVEKCPNGVPHKYPMDEQVVELSMVDQVQRLGLSEYFSDEIDYILKKVYRSYMVPKYSLQDSWNSITEKLYKDALAFRLFRMHGYNISTWTICWFLHDKDMLHHLEHNYRHFTSLFYSIYKATDLIFFGEPELHEARSFSRKMLQKISTLKKIDDDNIVIFPNLLQVIDEELNTPWIARLDHLDHRMWIEQNKEGPMWVGKASFYTLSCVHNTNLMQLALENYKFKQSIYQHELHELKGWSKKWGLTEMGFGREKTSYCYFAVSSSTSLPHDSLIRMLVAKSAILITVADDFFDEQGTLEELHVLNEAINRWDGEGLSGPSKVIFIVLDDLVREITNTLIRHGRIDSTEAFRSLWREIFNSWLTETTWGRSGYIPSADEYLQTSMISIATHILVLTAACFLNPSLPENKLKPQKYENITQSLMATTRLLNDIQSFQKEQEEGIMNFVALHFNQNPEASMDDSVYEVKRFLEVKRNELLKHVFTHDDDDNGDFSNQWKHLHLSCFKVFQMLFNSANLYDSEDELQLDIAKAIYISPGFESPKYLKPQTSIYAVPKKENMMIGARYVQIPDEHHPHVGMNIHQLSKRSITNIGSKVLSSMIFGSCFI